MTRALALALLLCCASVQAQYPSRPIQLVVLFTAGSDADFAARNLARHPLPGVPTARSLGWPEMESLAAWSALAAPPGLPAEVVERWSAALAQLSRDAQWLAGNGKLGGVPAVRSPAATEAFVRAQFGLYESLATRLGLRQ